MRGGEDWRAFVDRLERDRRSRVLTGQSERVAPRGDIMVVTEERRSRTDKRPGDDAHVQLVTLRSAEAIAAYRPIDHAHRVRRLMVIAVADDSVTPTSHAVDLYDAALPPKELVIQHRTTHYTAYEEYADRVIPRIVAWFDEHLRGDPLETRRQDPPDSGEGG
jgi:dipeptidyl aminopeptidase/acylaminoacyl peptidase